MQCTGIYWVGPVHDRGGFGNVSRNYLRALENVGIPVFVHSIGVHHPEIGEETIQWLQRLSTDRIGDKIVFIRHGLPGLFNIEFPLQNVVKNIGVTLFDTDRLPEGWAELCNRMDEVWVPTKFNHQTFSSHGVDVSRLKVIPYPIDVKKFYPGRSYTKIIFSPPVNSFTFLYVFGFDYSKGYDLLISAFCEEFSPREDVSLLLKVYVHSWSNTKVVRQEIESFIPVERSSSQILLILEPFDEEMLINLYQSSDVYASTDRACGWGMPEMEMMALGKPVIRLNWGGSTEFIDATNSFLVETENKLVPVSEKLQKALPELYANHCWDEVRIVKVRQVLREAYKNKEKRNEVAKKAALDIHFKYSPNAIGMQIKKQLGFQ